MNASALNYANIVASVAAAAAVPGAGAAANVISAALSGTALWPSLNQSERARAKETSAALDQHLAQTHLTEDRKRIVVQLVTAHVPSDRVLLDNGEVPEKIAEAMVRQVIANVGDPGQTSPQALSDYKAALVAILIPALAPEDRNEARQQDIHRNVQDLLALANQSGEAQRLAEAGVTEMALVGLAQRLAGSIEDVDQAWTELKNLVEIHLRLQREGHTPSNHGDFVDEVLRRVADLTATGDYAGAGNVIDQALKENEANRARLLDSGAEIAMLAGDAATAAGYLIRRTDLEAGGHTDFDAVRAIFMAHHEKGRDTGTALDLEVAVALARLIHARASSADERGVALNDLAVSLRVLGERESGTARLEEAVAAFRAALEERTRDRVPLQWAAAQTNLGNALATLGERDSGTARLKEAVAAYRAALEERTRDRVPLDWAGTQMNLGNALRILGERESGTARLEEAVTSYRVALEEWTRHRVPLDWASAQMNLGLALQRLGERESGTARLEEAIAAYHAALEVRPRDRLPIDWAMTQGNLAGLEIVAFDKTGDAAHLDRAETHARAAREVFVAAQASRYLEEVDRNLADIAARRGG